MASVEHHKATPGRHAFFLVRWRDEAGSSRSRSCRTLTEARALRSAMETALDAGTYRDDRRSMSTFEEFANQWIKTSTGGQAYRASRQSMLDNHLLPVLGGKRLVDLDTAELTRVIAGLRLKSGKPMARSSATSIAQLLSAILRAAEDEGRIATAPLPRRWPLPERTSDQRSFLTVDEVEALIAATDLYWRPLVMFLADSGCRWGEAVGLTDNRLVLDVGVVVIAGSLSEVRGKFSLKSTKSGRVRSVYLPTRTVEALRLQVTEHGLGRFRDTATSEEVKGLVFHGPTGAPIQRSLFARRVWAPAVKSAGLTDKKPTRHSLRHSHASHLFAVGVDVMRVAGRLGHSRPSVTTDIYGHLLAGGDAAAVESLEAFRKARE